MNGREKLLNSAFELFSTKGFDAVGIREIADHAGLTNPALYQHFKGKDELGEEVYRLQYYRRVEEVEKGLREDMSALEKIFHFIDAETKAHKRKPSPLLFLEDQQRYFGYKLKKELGDRSHTSRLGIWIDEGKANGEIRDDIPTPILVALVLGQLTKWAAMSSLSLAPTKNAAKYLKMSVEAALKA